MKTTYQWLKDFVEIKIPPEELADKLTMAGLEVVSLEKKGDDFVFEIEITSNRPDWLSVSGIAREVAAITGGKLKNAPVFSAPRKIPGRKIAGLSIEVGIEDKKDCPIYLARILRNVKVGPSPEWIKKRLELVGCRSINNVVDITNYVLFESGEPLHAFDLDKLASGKITVRRAKDKEKLLTIDGAENSLLPENLVIADSNRAVAVAGVMGGKESEVDFGTKHILLEAALFNPVIIRRSRQLLGKTTEASYRFERGVDPEAPERASRRAAQLLKDLCGAEDAGMAARGSAGRKIVTVDLDTGYLSRILGVCLGCAQAKKILLGLGFKVKLKAKNVLRVEVPSFRQDVKQPVDLIEEIARIYGYEKIPNSLPLITPDPDTGSRREIISEIKNLLVGLGLSEAITYSLVDRKGLKDAGLESETAPLSVMNPLSREQEVLRPGLALGLGRAVSFNLKQKQEYVPLFEIANVFKSGKEPEEKLALGIALSGTKSFFSGEGRVHDPASFLHLKGILEAVFSKLKLTGYEFVNLPAGRVEIFLHKNKIGSMLELGRQALDALEIKNHKVFICELFLEKVFSCALPDKKFISLPKYPGITRDISFVLKEEVSVESVIASIKENGGSLLREVKVADYYRGKQIPAGFRGLTLSCFYASAERTLTEKEIQPSHDLACEFLSRRFEVKLR